MKRAKTGHLAQWAVSDEQKRHTRSQLTPVLTDGLTGDRKRGYILGGSNEPLCTDLSPRREATPTVTDPILASVPTH
jgi:hypothetical protein